MYGTQKYSRTFFKVFIKAWKKNKYFIKNFFYFLLFSFFFLISVSNLLRLESWPSSAESPKETLILFKVSYTYKIPHWVWSLYCAKWIQNILEIFLGVEESYVSLRYKTWALSTILGGLKILSTLQTALFATVL